MTEMLPHALKEGRTGYCGLGLNQYIFNDKIFYVHSGFWGSVVAYCPKKKIIYSKKT